MHLNYSILSKENKLMFCYGLLLLDCWPAISSLRFYSVSHYKQNEIKILQQVASTLL